jgi:hypothetical protein
MSQSLHVRKRIGNLGLQNAASATVRLLLEVSQVNQGKYVTVTFHCMLLLLGHASLHPER